VTPAGRERPVEDSLLALYDEAPCGYLSTTPDGEIISVNGTFSKWVGFSPDELIGRTFRDLLPTGSQLFYETRYLPVLRLTGHVSEVALSVLRSDGTALSVLLNSVLVLDANNAPRLIRTAIFDSTGRQDYERALLAARRSAEESESRVRILQDAAAAFDATGTESSLAKALVDVMRDAFDAADSAVLLLDEDGSFRLAAGTHRLASLLPVAGPRPETDAVAATRVVTLTSLDEAFASYPSTAEAMVTARVAALAAVPLLSEGTAVGVLLCFFGRERTFDEHATGLQETLARQAMLVLARIRLQDELEYQALHDQLTGLSNRRRLRDHILPALAAAHRDNMPMAVILLDLDGFKEVNDSQGHIAGDALLRAVAERLQGAVRQEDIVGRLGGDEFLIVCANTDRRAAVAVAERVRGAVRAPFVDGSILSPITASVGVAVHSPAAGTSTDPATLYAAADRAMYQSKSAGKDRVTLIDL
jgi:diguanylate cyclase (GGDEF)-like protein/PAS domain S-box-containing protein